MFRQHRRRRRIDAVAAPDDGPEGSSISFYYVSVVGRVALS